MTKFADQLFDDLMREHGPALASIAAPAPPKRNLTARRALLAGGGTLAVAGAIAGTVVAGTGTTPARIAGSGSDRAARSSPSGYAVAKNSDGTITLAVYRKSAIAGVNARLRQLGDSQVVVVPVEAGCPAASPPAVPMTRDGTSMEVGSSANGSVTVSAQGMPAGDILVVGIEINADSMSGVAELTSPPAPSCISAAPSPPGSGGSRA